MNALLKSSIVAASLIAALCTASSDVAAQYNHYGYQNGNFGSQKQHQLASPTRHSYTKPWSCHCGRPVERDRPGTAR